MEGMCWMCGRWGRTVAVSYAHGELLACPTCAEGVTDWWHRHGSADAAVSAS